MDRDKKYSISDEYSPLFAMFVLWLYDNPMWNQLNHLSIPNYEFWLL